LSLSAAAVLWHGVNAVKGNSELKALIVIISGMLSVALASQQKFAD